MQKPFQCKFKANLFGKTQVTPMKRGFMKVKFQITYMNKFGAM